MIREILDALPDEKRTLLMEYFNDEQPFILPLSDGRILAVHHDTLPGYTIIERAGYWLLASKDES